MDSLPVVIETVREVAISAKTLCSGFRQNSRLNRNRLEILDVQLSKAIKIAKANADAEVFETNLQLMKKCRDAMEEADLDEVTYQYMMAQFRQLAQNLEGLLK